MAYLPHTKDDIEAMLKTIGADSVEQLFEVVPESVRFPKLDLPEGLSQMEVSWMLEDLSNENLPGGKAAIFLGAGAYNHYSPAVINHTILRGEFLTAYTPYQPEVSQGTLQATYEYQSMICALTGMEAANASHYDGATSLAEAVIMALNVKKGKRKKIVLSPGIHPEYRQVVRTYTQGMGLDITGDGISQLPDEAGYTAIRSATEGEKPSFVGDESDIVNLDALIAEFDEDTAMVAVGYPNFFGQIEDIGKIIEAAHAQKILVCVVIDPIALGMLKPPGAMGADIVVGEGQGLGIPMSYGGPYLGLFATKNKYVRKMSGRLVGETVDVDGNPGYVLTLATREQHIRRERATSNICTNQGLIALAASVYLSLMGKQGLRKIAELCYHKAHYAAEQINNLPGYSVDLSRPFFKEFVVQCPQSASEINTYLLDSYTILGGYDLSSPYPARQNQMLIAVTEMNTREEIDLLVQALSEAAE